MSNKHEATYHGADQFTPQQWAQLKNITVLDPDGWRIDGKNFDDPVTEAEFMQRATLSTIRFG